MIKPMHRKFLVMLAVAALSPAAALRAETQEAAKTGQGEDLAQVEQSPALAQARQEAQKALAASAKKNRRFASQTRRFFKTSSSYHYKRACQGLGDGLPPDSVPELMQNAADRALGACWEAGLLCGEPQTELQDEPDGCYGYARVQGDSNPQGLKGKIFNGESREIWSGDCAWRREPGDLARGPRDLSRQDIQRLKDQARQDAVEQCQEANYSSCLALESHVDRSPGSDNPSCQGFALVRGIKD